MTRNELKDMIAHGESSTVEFKRKFTSYEKIAKEISAFSNTKGGFILFGVDDDGRIVGVESEKEIIEQVETCCSFHIDPQVSPSIEIVHIERKDVIVTYIPESLRKPHAILAPNDNGQNGSTGVYIRQGEESVSASREMVRLLRSLNDDAPPLMLSIGDHERRLFAFLDKNRRATVQDFATLCNISDRRAARLMVRLVRAGVLNIHSDEQRDYYTLVDIPQAKT